MTTNSTDLVDRKLRIELADTFPVPLEEGFNFLSDVDHWPYWHPGMIKILGWRRQTVWSVLRRAPSGGAWLEPGDTVFFTYKVLGHRSTGTAVLKEIRKHEVMRSVVNIDGLPEMRQEFSFSAVGEGSFQLKVVLESDGITDVDGTVADPTLFPHIMSVELEAMMANLEDVFVAGVPQPPWWP